MSTFLQRFITGCANCQAAKVNTHLTVPRLSPLTIKSSLPFLTVFILEQVPAGSMSEASKYQVLKAQFQRWFHNFPTPFRDGTGTLSVTAPDSSCALLRLRSIGSIRQSSYSTFLTSNFSLLLFSDFITYILQGTSSHIADDIR